MDARTLDRASDATTPFGGLEALAHPIATRASAYALMTAAGVIAFLLELTIGAVRIPLSDVVAILAGSGSDHTTWTQIVLSFRFPRAMNALASGAALGVCGLVLQTLFRNALADPFVLGIMHGARLGVAILVVITGVAGPVFAARFGKPAQPACRWRQHWARSAFCC
jgi:ABC-type Fe3+-siderophore transport system permease subunit